MIYSSSVFYISKETEDSFESLSSTGEERATLILGEGMTLELGDVCLAQS